MKEKTSIFGTFKQAALTIDGLGDVDDQTMKKIYSALAKQAFNAYTSFRWGEKFKGNKDSSGDKDNISFRQLLQTTGTDGSKNAPKARPYIVRKRRDKCW